MSWAMTISPLTRALKSEVISPVGGGPWLQMTGALLRWVFGDN